MDVLTIFYDNILKEAAQGRINSFFYYNIVFNTILDDDGIRYDASVDLKDLMIPTLHIKNKAEFDELLVNYVDKCLDFYDNSNFSEEVVSGEMYDEVDRISKEKTILAFLFANATIEDFSDPSRFLRRRIDFFDATKPCKYDLGQSSILDCNLQVEVCKDKLNNETPYQFVVRCISDTGEEYELPRLKFGVSDNKAYVYAIQNYNKQESAFSKKINRKLYKVGEGFSKEKDNFDIYEEGNLNDISPSFLLVANLFTSYMDKMEIDDFVISPILLERWNSKVMSNEFKSKRGKKPYAESYEEQLRIQSNLTEKFLRTFLRLNHHCDNLSVTAYPAEQGFDLCLTNDGIIRGNNSLLNETANMMSKAQKIGSAENGLHK